MNVVETDLERRWSGHEGGQSRHHDRTPRPCNPLPTNDDGWSHRHPQNTLRLGVDQLDESDLICILR